MNSISVRKIGITRLSTDAIVNAANTGLLEGGGVCGAVFREAGSRELTAACSKYGHCDTGKAVITPGFNLKAKYIIHAVGPVWNDGHHKEPSLLYDAYKNSLITAKENGCHSIGFPLISSGIFGYPLDGAWRKAIQACDNFLMSNPDYGMEIIFAVLDDNVLKLGMYTIREICGEKYSCGKSGNGDNTDALSCSGVNGIAPQTDILPGKYRHYKGNEYEVIGIARHSETEEKMVVYKALYGAGELWVRPAKMWNELVDVNGKLVRRFERIAD